jgi:hypothetical protein
MQNLSNVYIELVEDIENQASSIVAGSFNEGFDFGFYN